MLRVIGEINYWLTDMASNIVIALKYLSTTDELNYSSEGSIYTGSLTHAACVMKSAIRATCIFVQWPVFTRRSFPH